MHTGRGGAHSGFHEFVAHALHDLQERLLTEHDRVALGGQDLPGDLSARDLAVSRLKQAKLRNKHGESGVEAKSRRGSAVGAKSRRGSARDDADGCAALQRSPSDVPRFGSGLWQSPSSRSMGAIASQALCEVSAAKKVANAAGELPNCLGFGPSGPSRSGSSTSYGLLSACDVLSTARLGGGERQSSKRLLDASAHRMPPLFSSEADGGSGALAPGPPADASAVNPGSVATEGCQDVDGTDPDTKQRSKSPRYLSGGDDDDDEEDWDDEDPGFEVIDAWGDEFSNFTPKALFSSGSPKNGAALLQTQFGCQYANRKSGASLGSGGIEVSSESAVLGRFLQRLPPALPYDSALRVLWDIGCITMIVYDLFRTPLGVFDIGSESETPFMIDADWVARVFWSADLFMNFGTGFMDNLGRVERRLDVVVVRYVRSWFAIDMALVIFSWVELSIAWIGWLVAVRGVRLIRLLRFARLRTVSELLRWSIQSDVMFLWLGILKQVLGLLTLSHVLACAWYFVSFTSKGHAVSFGLAYEDENGEPPSLGSRYAWSMQWALMNFTGLGIFITPDFKNLMEVAFGIGTMLLTFVVSACFLSLITTSMTRYSIMHDQSLVQSAVLRKYLHDQGISGHLAAAVQHSAQHAALELKRNIPEKDIELLALVSKPLLVELHYELHAHHLLRHPFWVHIEQSCIAAVRQICHRAMATSFAPPSTAIFSVGEVPAHPSMYFLTRGSAQYVSGLDDSEQTIHPGATLCEAFLWTSWSYVGTLFAIEDCSVLILEAEAFQQLATEFTPVAERSHIQLYAREFVGHLSKFDPVDLRDTIDWRHIKMFANRAFGASDKRSVRAEGSRRGSFADRSGASAQSLSQRLSRFSAMSRVSASSRRSRHSEVGAIVPFSVTPSACHADCQEVEDAVTALSSERVRDVSAEETPKAARVSKIRVSFQAGSSSAHDLSDDRGDCAWASSASLTSGGAGTSRNSVQVR